MNKKVTFRTFDEYKENTTKPIDSFCGKWDFLSNFSNAEVTYEDVTYPTLEHAFQAAKTLVPNERKMILLARTPGRAKRLGKTVTLRKNWNRLRLRIMEGLLRQKFRQYTDDYFKLMHTAGRDLIEGNHWNDTYWGICKGKGKNHLGKLLMKIRDERFPWGHIK